MFCIPILHLAIGQMTACQTQTPGYRKLNTSFLSESEFIAYMKETIQRVKEQ